MREQHQHHVSTDWSHWSIIEIKYSTSELWNSCMFHLDMHILIWKSWLLNTWGFKLSWFSDPFYCFLHFPFFCFAFSIWDKKNKNQIQWMFLESCISCQIAEFLWSDRCSGNRKQMKSWNCCSVCIVFLAVLMQSCNDYVKIQTRFKLSRSGPVGSRAVFCGNAYIFGSTYLSKAS